MCDERAEPCRRRAPVCGADGLARRYLASRLSLTAARSMTGARGVLHFRTFRRRAGYYNPGTAPSAAAIQAAARGPLVNILPTPQLGPRLMQLSLSGGVVRNLKGDDKQ